MERALIDSAVAEEADDGFGQVAQHYRISDAYGHGAGLADDRPARCAGEKLTDLRDDFVRMGPGCSRRATWKTGALVRCAWQHVERPLRFDVQCSAFSEM